MDNYQNIFLNGKGYGHAKRKNSNFFNEGKWKNFIEPFLPDNCEGMTLIDFGCNYGLFIKLAKEKNFKTIIGVEQNKAACEIAEKFIGDDGKIINYRLDEKIYQDNFLNELPASDYILLANFHYHMLIGALLHFLNIIKRKTRYAIVVSSEDAISKIWNGKHDLQSIRRYFGNWIEKGYICMPAIDDKVPRKMFSCLFKTEIERIPISDVVSKFGNYSGHFYRKVKRDTTQDNIVPMTYPVLLRQNGSLVDGHHRMAGLELNNETTILAEKT